MDNRKSLHDIAKVHLGRKLLADLPKAKLLKMAAIPILHDFVSLPTPPPSRSWGKKVTTPWGMYLNDREGDCTCATIPHMLINWTTWTKASPLILPNSAIQAADVAVTGQEGAAFNPATGANDNGCAVVDVLNYWVQNGVGGNRLAAYAAIRPSNQTSIQQAVSCYGGCYLGVALPLTAQKQKVWDVGPLGLHGPGAPGSWGGHAIPIVSYGPLGITVVTWGTLQTATWRWLAAYCEEAYACLSAGWIADSGVAPSGLQMAALQTDLAAFADSLAA